MRSAVRPFLIVDNSVGSRRDVMSIRPLSVDEAVIGWASATATATIWAMAAYSMAYGASVAIARHFMDLVASQDSGSLRL
jgi:hypothetical protein